VSFDANAYRQASLEGWEAAASGWVRRGELLRAFAAPVSHRMVEVVSPQPGERVLELAAGLGETAMLAAELVAPLGGVIVSDQAEAMLEGARARSIALGLSNVEFQVLNAEWIDLPLASVDVVLCRWGFMLMADPGAALAETRRVLRPGGRVALAAWDSLQHNPWALEPAQELIARGLTAAPDPTAEPTPGPFALSEASRVQELLEQAGFAEIEIEAIELSRRHLDFDELWDTTLDLSRSFHDAVLSRPQREIEQIRQSLAERFAPYTAADGTLAIPARTLLASASA
jgi:ubiquinone/menaquinone biosynthesis C-methylase UbiE